MRLDLNAGVEHFTPCLADLQPPLPVPTCAHQLRRRLNDALKPRHLEGIARHQETLDRGQKCIDRLVLLGLGNGKRGGDGIGRLVGHGSVSAFLRRCQEVGGRRLHGSHGRQGHGFGALSAPRRGRADLVDPTAGRGPLVGAWRRLGYSTASFLRSEGGTRFDAQDDGGAAPRPGQGGHQRRRRRAAPSGAPRAVTVGDGSRRRCPPRAPGEPVARVGAGGPVLASKRVSESHGGGGVPARRGAARRPGASTAGSAPTGPRADHAGRLWPRQRSLTPRGRRGRRRAAAGRRVISVCGFGSAGIGKRRGGGPAAVRRVDRQQRLLADRRAGARAPRVVRGARGAGGGAARAWGRQDPARGRGSAESI